MILSCHCKHAAQDRFHGKGKRVHNPFKTASGNQGGRCTVCGNTRDVK